jgi:isopenicillin-N epimerase
MSIPPHFGRSLLPLWALDPAITYLNHGTVGATPRAVMAAQAALRDEIERQPARFLLRELTPIGVQAAPAMATGAAPPHARCRRRVIPWLGVAGDDLVRRQRHQRRRAVLASFARAGDEVLVTNRTYGAVARAAAHHAARSGALTRTAALPFPLSDPAALVDALLQALTPRTRLAVLDHVSPETALVMPLADGRGLPRRGVAVADGRTRRQRSPSTSVARRRFLYHEPSQYLRRAAARPGAAPVWRDRLHPPVILGPGPG